MGNILQVFRTYFKRAQAVQILNIFFSNDCMDLTLVHLHAFKE